MVNSGKSEAKTQIYVSKDHKFQKLWEEFDSRFDEGRYFIPPTSELIKHYFDFIMSEQKSRNLTRGMKFFRARINDGKNPMGSKDLEAPPKEVAKFGRLNVSHIPVLYMAEQFKTAIQEVQPHREANVAIAVCTAKKDLHVLDLTIAGDNKNSFHDFRRMIGQLFSKPHKPNEKERNYLPTQYLAEYIKNKGYDGVKYLSTLHEGGINICIFEPDNFTVQYQKEVVIGKVDIDWREKKVDEKGGGKQ